MCAREGVCAYTHVYRPKESPGVVPQELPTLLFETESLSGTWSSGTQLGWMDTKYQASSCLHLLRAGIINIQAFDLVLNIQLGSSSCAASI